MGDCEGEGPGLWSELGGTSAEEEAGVTSPHPPEAAGTPTPRLTVLAVSFPAQHMLFRAIRSFCLNQFLRSHDPKSGTHSVTHLFNHPVIHSGP